LLRKEALLWCLEKMLLADEVYTIFYFSLSLKSFRDQQQAVEVLASFKHDSCEFKGEEHVFF
jgi:hypothetical protein